MPLSCSCDFDGDEEGVTFFKPPKDYKKYQNENACICESCRNSIKKDEICTEFICWSFDENGDGIHRPSDFLCEECSDIYFNLTELGFECILPFEDMHDLLSEYHYTYGMENDPKEASQKAD